MAYDLALHLKAFSEKGEVHKEAFEKLHGFLEKVGSDCLSEDCDEIEFVYPEQALAMLEFSIRKFYGLDLSIRKKFRGKK